MAGLSTALGSCFVFCSSRANTSVLARALGGSAGVMIYVSFVEIFSTKSVYSFTEVCDGNDKCGWRWATMCFFIGLVFMYGLDYVVHSINDSNCGCCSKKPKEGKEAASHGHEHSFLSIHANLDECVRDIAKMEGGGKVEQKQIKGHGHARDEHGYAHDEHGHARDERGHAHDEHGHAHNHGESREANACEQPSVEEMRPGVTVDNVDLTDVHHKAIEAKKLRNMGMMTALAIGLHNFPEGLATFVAALADPKLGAALAIAIAIHNIPEGICVAMPIYYATGSKWKGFWWSFFSGLSEPVGAIVGYCILKGNGMSPEAFGALFGIVAGMMVFIAIKELIPTALKYDPHDAYVTNYIFLGFAVMALSLIVFYI